MSAPARPPRRLDSEGTDNGTQLLLKASQMLEDARLHFVNRDYAAAYKAYISTASFFLNILPLIKDVGANQLIRQHLDSIMDTAERCKLKCKKQEEEQYATLTREQKLKAKQAKALATRDRVAMEIYATERSYVKGLKQLLDHYVKPLKIAAKTSLPILTSSEIHLLFSSIIPILGLNEKFQSDLGERIKTWNASRCMGDLFLSFAPYFKMYLGYVSQFSSISKHVFKLADENIRFQRFLDCAESNSLYPDVPNMQSLMIMPVQRIPRYKLLLEEMLKQTPKSHEDHSLLLEAIEKTDLSAKHINESLKKADNQVKIWEIQGMFQENVSLLNRKRIYIREGPLRKVNRRGGLEQLYFFLFSDVIVYGVKLGKNRYNYRRTVTFISAKPLDDHESGEKFCFQITAPEKVIVLFAGNAAQRDSWVKEITENAQKNQRMRHSRQRLIARGVQDISRENDI